MSWATSSTTSALTSLAFSSILTALTCSVTSSTGSVPLNLCRTQIETLNSGSWSHQLERFHCLPHLLCTGRAGCKQRPAALSSLFWPRFLHFQAVCVRWGTKRQHAQQKRISAHFVLSYFMTCLDAHFFVMLLPHANSAACLQYIYNVGELQSNYSTWDRCSTRVVTLPSGPHCLGGTLLCLFWANHHFWAAHRSIPVLAPPFW